MSKIPHFDVNINFDNPKSDILNLLSEWRPSWKRNEIQFEELSGGVINVLYHCFKTTKRHHGVVIRIFSDRLDSSVFGEKKNRDKDILYVKALSEIGCFPRFLASFQNGYCYEFYDGFPLSNNLNNLGQDEYISAMTKAMVKLHNTRVGPKPKRSDFLMMLEKGIQKTSQENFTLMKQSIPNFPSKTELLRDLRLIEDDLYQSGSPIVLCHDDFHTSNLLWNTVDDHVKLVDCDVIWYNYQGFDIGYHFISFYFENVNGGQKLPIPEEQYMRKFIRHYLCHWFESQGKDPEEVTPKDVDRLLIQSKKGMLASALYLLSFFVSVIHSRKSLGILNVIDFTRRRNDFYQSKKDEYLSLQVHPLDEEQSKGP